MNGEQHTRMHTMATMLQPLVGVMTVTYTLRDVVNSLIYLVRCDIS